MPLAAQSPDLPDLVVSDFFTFGHLKNCLQGIAALSHEELVPGMKQILAKIADEFLQGVFEH
jgi:hypothetical protein